MSPQVLRVRDTAERRRLDLPVSGTCALVIFGGTGDLTKKKLMPSLYRLHKREALHPCFSILGIGRGEMETGAYRTAMRGAVERAEDEAFDAEAWDDFAPRLDYLGLDLTGDDAYRDLGRKLTELGSGDPALGNHLFYFAVPPVIMSEIVRGLDDAGLAEQGEGWTRIVVEKPFGRDLESARELNEVIAGTFDESQVFRIDHFLGKETVQNILAFRFGNTLFEPIWNRNYVDFVEITAAESFGLEGRGGFYEGTGALRDMVANHLLQLLCLTAMEPPVAYDADAIREEKVKVLRSISPMTPEEVARATVRGQHGPGTVHGEDVPGYRSLDGVDGSSHTETFAAVEFRIDNWRWSDVPFYVRTGKRLARTVTEIAVHFNRIPHSLFSGSDGVSPNTLVLRFKPEEGIDMTFSAKVPGEGMRTSRVRMEFDYADAFGVEMPEAYETLLLEAMEGDPTLFTRGDEAEAQWRLIEPILEAWADSEPEFPNYAAGSEGPEAAFAIPRRSGHAWRSLAEASDRDTGPHVAIPRGS